MKLMTTALATTFLFFSACADVPDAGNVNMPPVSANEEYKFSDADSGFKILMYGKRMFPDADSYNRLLALLGSLITDRTVNKYQFSNPGIEGGGTFCIELRTKAPELMNRVYKLFQTLEVAEDTEYEVKPVANCQGSTSSMN